MASIEERLTKIVSDHLGVDPAHVTPAAKLEDELGADSLDLAELTMAVEEEFELEIPDDDAEKFKTVGDFTAYVSKYLAADGE
jgi:acyl carrier protein